MKIWSRRILAGTTACLTAFGVVACGSSGSSDQAGQNQNGRGPITYVQGKDNTGDVQNIMDKWNALHPDQKVTLKEQSDSADDQHSDLVQHFKAQDSGYDVTSVDVVWTAEFAAQGWLTPLEGQFAVDKGPLLPAAVKAGSYQDKMYAAPYATDGGMLFYRTDLVPKPPTTWAELEADCQIAKAHQMGCYAGQFAKYEGLIVNASEAINAAGGEVVKPDGKTADVDTPQAKQGLDFLVNGYKTGIIPPEAITFKEEPSRQAFESGKLLFMRNWSSAYNLAQTDGTSTVKDKFGVTTEPGPNGPGASTLGGHDLGVSAFSKNKATAIDFIKFMESSEIQREVLTKQSNAPVLTALYSDPQLLADPKLGFLKTLGESLSTAKARPVTPFYPAVGSAIEENAYAAIKGDKSTEQALKDMQAAINSASGS